jgi:hypothetical protein
MINIIISYLIDLSIPHNIIISECGTTFYIIPRNFNEVKSNLEYNTNWLDLSGFLTVKTQSFFDNSESRINEFYDFISNKLTLKEESYKEITFNIIKKLQGSYKVNIY